MASRHVQHSWLQHMQHNPVHDDSAIAQDLHAPFFKTLNPQDKQRIEDEYEEAANQLAQTMDSRVETPTRLARTSTRTPTQQPKSKFSRQQLEHMLADLRSSLDNSAHANDDASDEEETKLPSTPRGDMADSSPWSQQRGRRRRPQSAYTRMQGRPRSSSSSNASQSRPKSAASGHKQRCQIEHERQVKEMQEVQESECNVRFKAREVPYSTLLPRYQVMMEDMDAKASVRKMARQERLQQMVAPFSGMEQRANEQKLRAERRRNQALANEEHTRRSRDKREQHRRQLARRAVEKQESETSVCDLRRLCDVCVLQGRFHSLSLSFSF
jgi:hypothetical protein